MKTIEYRVRPVTRYIITRYEDEDGNGAVSTIGEFDNRASANDVCSALARGAPNARATPMPETPEPVGTFHATTSAQCEALMRFVHSDAFPSA